MDYYLRLQRTEEERRILLAETVATVGWLSQRVKNLLQLLRITDEEYNNQGLPVSPLYC